MRSLLRLVACGASLAVIGAFAVSLPSEPAQALGGPQQWFIAQSGTANFAGGSSCAAPDVVGSDDTAIRTVLDAVASDDTVTICSGTYSITQTLIVDDSITIQGEAAATSILDGGESVQIMRLTDDDTYDNGIPEVEVVVSDMTLRDGSANSGGAIYVEGGGILTVYRSSFEGNRASTGIGGAIGNVGNSKEIPYLGGTVRVFDSTFVDNRAYYDGGAIAVTASNRGTTLTVENSTFVNNTAETRSGGAINASFSQGSVTASTFIDNSATYLGRAVRGSTLTLTGNILVGGTGSASMCSAAVFSANASNVATDSCDSAVVVTSDSLNLRGLGDWGGPTETVWIGPGSTAIDANTGVCPTLDQRGATRSASPCDAGAFERQGASDETITGSLDYPSNVQALSSEAPILSPSFGGGGRTVGYMSLTPSECTVNQITGVVVGVAGGVCEAQWFVAPTLLADGAAQDDTLTVSKAAQATLTITSGNGPLAPGDTLTLTTSGGSGTGAITFTASPAGVCSVAGTTLTALDAGTCQVSATKAADGSYLSATSAPVAITLQTQTPVIVPAGPPLNVRSTGGDGSVVVSWDAPESSGSFPATHHQVSGSPAGSCLIPATALSCEISGLRNGVEYSIRVRALTGAGWGAWSEPVTVVPSRPTPRTSLVIVGSRNGPLVVLEGSAVGLSGISLTPWVRFPGPHAYEAGAGVQTVAEDGTFTWQRETRKKIYVYFKAESGLRSNRLIIPAR